MKAAHARDAAHSPLLDLLATPDGAAIAVLPAAAPASAPETTPAATPSAPRRLAAALLLPAARLVLRRPAVRQLALRLLKRSPALYARAYRMMMASGGAGAPQPAPGQPPASTLSPRAASILHTLGELQASAPRAIGARPRLAFVTPLPPERSGIATYSCELLAELMAHADIELVVSQDAVALPPELAHLPLRSADWFARHGAGFDQVLYQFGNSPLHSHMLGLMARHPGVVVLHDFFIGGALVHAQMSGHAPLAWSEALLASHGYRAVLATTTPAGRAQAHKDWPASLPLLEQASRVIVHSDHARRLVGDWFGADAARRIDVIPLLRTPPAKRDRAAARAALGIPADCFLVCSFGFIAPHKLTRELLTAWIGSTLHADRHCALVLVGANHDSPYGVEVDTLVRRAGGAVRIAGWTDDAVYRQYLQAADLGIQLRTNAQGESSAAVLDCMSHGLATIVNANGSMGEFPDDAVWRLPDMFEVAELTTALETLRADPLRRQAFGASAAALLDAFFRPAACAQQYLATLAQACADDAVRDMAWRAALSRLPATDEDALQCLATTLAEHETGLQRRLLVDVSDWQAPGAAPDSLTAQQLRELLGQHSPALRIEPVYLDRSAATPRYRQARNAVGRLLGLGWAVQDEPVVDLRPGDIYYAPDAGSPAVTTLHAGGQLQAWRARGVTVMLLVRTAEQATSAQVAGADRLLCLSEALARQLTQQADAVRQEADRL